MLGAPGSGAGDNRPGLASPVSCGGVPPNAGVVAGRNRPARHPLFEQTGQRAL